MPPRKSPDSLYTLSVRAFVQSFIQVWYKHHKRQVNYEGQLTVLPPQIVDYIIQEAIEKYGQLSNADIRCPNMNFFLRSVIVPKMKILNLKLLSTSHINHHELLVSKLPLLNNLVNLSLRKIGVQNDFPLCTNEILLEIGRNCNNLEILDISNNYSVTDFGLNHLIPTDRNKGCPRLKELFMYNCSVTEGFIANILEKLDNLTAVGHKATGLAIWHLKQKQPGYEKTLKLRYVNNYDTIAGIRNGNYESNLREMYQSINKMCPDMNMMRIRLTDEDLNLVEHFKNLTSVKLLLYLEGVALCPGNGTDRFFNIHGAQLLSISIACDQLSEEKVIMLGQTCPLLQCFWLICNHYIGSKNTKYPSHIFRHLKSLRFTIGCSHFKEYFDDMTFIESILMSTDGIEDLHLAINSILIDDFWLRRFVGMIKTHLLKVILITLPGEFRPRNALSLSLDTAYFLIMMLPALKVLGNLAFWNITIGSIKQLRSKVKAENYDLKVFPEI